MSTQKSEYAHKKYNTYVSNIHVGRSMVHGQHINTHTQAGRYLWTYHRSCPITPQPFQPWSMCRTSADRCQTY